VVASAAPTEDRDLVSSPIRTYFNNRYRAIELIMIACDIVCGNTNVLSEVIGRKRNAEKAATVVVYLLSNTSDVDNVTKTQNTPDRTTVTSNSA